MGLVRHDPGPDREVAKGCFLRLRQSHLDEEGAGALVVSPTLSLPMHIDLRPPLLV